MVGTIIPWKVWGRYNNEGTKEDDDHVAAHVDFMSVTYEFKTTHGEPKERTFVLQEVLLDDADRVVIKALEHLPGAQPWEFTFRKETGAVAGESRWVLTNNSNGASISIKLPMTQKYWILRFGGWHVLGVNVVLWGGLLLLLWYNFS